MLLQPVPPKLAATIQVAFSFSPCTNERAAIEFNLGHSPDRLKSGCTMRWVKAWWDSAASCHSISISLGLVTPNKYWHPCLCVTALAFRIQWHRYLRYWLWLTLDGTSQYFEGTSCSYIGLTYYTLEHVCDLIVNGICADSTTQKVGTLMKLDD